MLLTFLLRPASDHHFYSFVTYPPVGFPEPLGNFDYAVAGSINLAISSKENDAFHYTGFDYSRLDCDGFFDYIRNMHKDVLLVLLLLVLTFISDWYLIYLKLKLMYISLMEISKFSFMCKELILNSGLFIFHDRRYND